MLIVLMVLVVDGMILSIDVPGLDFFSRTTAEEGCCSETLSLIDLPSVLLFTSPFLCVRFCVYFVCMSTLFALIFWGDIYSSHWLMVPHAGK